MTVLDTDRKVISNTKHRTNSKAVAAALSTSRNIRFEVFVGITEGKTENIVKLVVG